MAVKTKDELLSAINDLELEEDTKISFLEDITDTIDNLSSEDWKTKYEENDAMWKEKYRNRFFNSTTPDEEKLEPDDEPKKPLSFEDLFKVTV